jgi:endonuclease/exonuclease/phosphatase (EEP) superfamily protein YafD
LSGGELDRPGGAPRRSRKKNKRWPREVAFSLLAAALIALVAAGWQWAVHFVPWLALLAAAGCGLALASGARWGAAPWGTAALMLGIPVAASLVPLPLAAVPGCEVSVMTFNTKLTRGPNEASVARMITRNPTDIVLLQEVMRPAVLFDLIRADPAYAAYHVLTREGSGLVVLSRFPITGPIDLPAGFGVQVRIAGRPVRLLTGVSSRDHDDPDSTGKLASQFLAALPKRAAPVIIGADMNSGPYAEPLRRLHDGLIDVFGVAGRGFGFTFPTPGRSLGLLGAFVRTDYIFADHDFQPSAARVLDDYAGSTHYPLRAALTLRASGGTSGKCAAD